MSNMEVEVSFLAGTDFVTAVLEAKEKAARWDVQYIKFNFNSVSCSIGRNADVSKALETFNRVISPKYEGFKMVIYS